MRSDADCGDDNGEDQIPTGVALHGHTRVAREVLLCFRERFELPEKDLLAQG